jgi:methylglutaconyl-CoA hydratase
MLIDFELAGPVAKITLNRPEKRNALNNELMSGLFSSLGRAETARVVTISGAEPDFCAGMDIELLHRTADAGVMEHIELAQKLARVYSAIRKHPRPVIALVKGRALGGGAGIATACDLVLASESAQIGYPEVKIGFMPAMVMALLRRSVGEKRAFEVMAMGDPFTARQARKLGIVNHVYSDETFDADAAAFVAALASRAPSAVGLTKRLLYHTDGMSFDQAMEAGIEANAMSRMTEDARKGMEKFTKK